MRIRSLVGFACGTLIAGGADAQVSSTYPPAPATSPYTNYVLLTGSSTTGWPVPAGATQLLVCGVGQGGGGGGAVNSGIMTAKGAGGASGDFNCVLYPATPGTSIPYSNLNTGGGGGTGSGGGATGSSATFGSTLTFFGGPGGAGSPGGGAAAPNQSLLNNSRFPIIPPSSGPGIVLLTGTPPTPPSGASTSTAGAPSPWGAGGAGLTTDGNGNPGAGYGAGGSGAWSSTTTSETGGAGSPSAIVVRW